MASARLASDGDARQAAFLPISRPPVSVADQLDWTSTAGRLSYDDGRRCFASRAPRSAYFMGPRSAYELLIAPAFGGDGRPRRFSLKRARKRHFRRIF